jgi:hypothetical protein
MSNTFGDRCSSPGKCHLCWRDGEAGGAGHDGRRGQRTVFSMAKAEPSGKKGT